MSASTGGLFVHSNSDEFLVGDTPNPYDVGWEAYGKQLGDNTVVEDPDNARLTVRPGKYKIAFTADMLTEDVSESESESTDVVGRMTFQVRLDGEEVDGLRAIVYAPAKNQPLAVAINGLAFVPEANAGHLQVFVSTDAANWADIVLTNAQFVATKVA